jgi:ABC-type glycerol-3-phosphate transport system substrate-binding protein
VRLRLWTWWAPGVLAGAEEWNTWQAAEFARRNPNVTVETEFVRTGIVDKFLAAAAANDPPEVSHASVSWARDAFDRGAVQAIDPYLARTPDAAMSNFLAVATTANQARGKVFGLPGEGPALASIPYNRNQLQEAGLPADPAAVQRWTWDEFAAAAVKLTRREGESVVRGAISFGANLGLQNFVTLLYANGVPGLYQDEGKRLHPLVRTRGVEALQYFYDLTAGKYRVTAAPGDGETPRSMWFGGRVAMHVSDSDAHASLNALKPADLVWDPMPFPRGPGGDRLRSVGWSNMHLVPAGSKQPEWGFRFAAFNAGLDAGLKRLALVGATSARKAFYEQEAWKAYVRQQPQQAVVYDQVRFQDAAGAYPTVRQGLLGGALNPLVLDLLKGQRSAREVVDEFVAQADGTILADVP